MASDVDTLFQRNFTTYIAVALIENVRLTEK